MSDLEARWAALEEASAAHQPTYRYYKPLADAADKFVAEAQDPNRIYTGVPLFDDEMRGIGRGHLCNIVGYSHSGKTLLLLRILQTNRLAHIAYFDPDETAPLVLAKLAAIETGIPSREFEQRVASGDQEAIRLLREIATEVFPNVVVFDGPLTPQSMEGGYSEAKDVWGAEADLFIVDYVDLLQAGETAPAKFDFIKGFGLRHYIPGIAIHQTSRSAGAQGREMGIDSGNFGGEQHATFQFGVRRKISALKAERAELRPKAANGNENAIERLEAVEYEMDIHQYTLTVNLVKNKRPGGGLVDEVDFELYHGTGRIRQMTEGELPEQWLAKRRGDLAKPLHQEPEIEYEYEYDEED